MKKALSTLAAIIISIASMAQSPEEFSQLMAQSNQYAGSGNIGKAIETAEKAKSVLVKAKLTGYRQDYADVLNTLGYYYLNANPKKGFECFMELADIFQEANSTDNYIDMLNTIAVEYARTGDFENSRKYFSKLFSAWAGAEYIDFVSADTWKNTCETAVKLLEVSDNWTTLPWDEFACKYFQELGKAMLNSKDAISCMNLMEELQKVQKSKDGEISERYCETMQIYSTAAIAAGKYNEALDSDLRRLELMEQLYGTLHAEYKNCLMQISQIYGAMGQAEKRNEYLELYNGASNTKRRDKSSAEYLEEQFLYNMNIGRYTIALDFGQKTVSAMEKSGIPNMEAYINNINRMGYCYSKISETKKSLDCFSKVLDIMKEKNDTLSDQYMASLNNVAQAYMNLGDYENDQYYKLKVVKAIATSEGIPLPNTGRDIRDAEILIRAIVGNNSLDPKIKARMIELMNYIVSAREKFGFSKTIELLKLILNRLEEAVGRNNYEGLAILRTIGQLYWENEQYSDAKLYFEAAELTALSIYGSQSMEYASVIQLLADTYQQLGQNENALINLQRISNIYNRNIGDDNEMYYKLMISQALAYNKTGQTDSMAITLDKILEIKKKLLKHQFSFMTEKQRLHDYQTNIDPILDFYFTSAFELPKSKYVGSSYDMELLSKGLLLSSSKEFNSYIRNCTDPGILELHAKLIENSRIIKEESSKSASKRVSNYNDLLIENSNLEMQLVAKSTEFADLTQNIDISWHDVKKHLKKNDVAIEFVHSKHGTYMALVLTNNTKYPEAVPLFNERDLKRLVYESSDSDSDLELKYYESTALYNNIWKRLEEYLEPGCNIYFAPKGLLHQIAIEYAPMPDGTLFFNKYNVYRISSTRNIVTNDKNKQDGAIYLYGGIQYNYKEGGSTLQYLPGSLEEVNNISNSLANQNAEIVSVTGHEATASRFEQMSGKNIAVIHVATHGIFQIADGNTLENSGLAMSDRVIKSSKISEMDLSSAGLVVLSACETAKGNVSSEGVFGLQRAFKLAGCKSIIMSLWPVNDFATQLMMSNFYRNIYESGMTERMAFNKAIEDLKAKKGTTPWHWAAFIMLD